MTSTRWWLIASLIVFFIVPQLFLLAIGFGFVVLFLLAVAWPIRWLWYLAGDENATYPEPWF